MTVGSDSVRLFAYATVLFMYGTNLNNLINETTEKFIELYNWCVHIYVHARICLFLMVTDCMSTLWYHLSSIIYITLQLSVRII